MALAKVLARGQVTLPRDVRRAAGVKPGDTVMVRATGPGRVIVELLPSLTLEEALERYRIEEPFDWAQERERVYDDAARDALGR